MPRPMLPVALIVRRDEPCLLLAELNLKTPDNHGFRRYQVLIVVRDDRPAEFRIDLGPVTTEEQFRILGCVQSGGEPHIEVLHTVEELQDIAEYMRDRHSGWTGEIEPRDLVTGYHDYMEQLPLVLEHVSVSGPLVTVTRE